MAPEKIIEIEAAIICKIENILSQEQTDAYYEEKDARALESYLRSLQIVRTIKREEDRHG